MRTVLEEAEGLETSRISGADPLIFGDVQAAGSTISGTALLTPVLPLAYLGQNLAVPVSLKCEQLEAAGSFKIRGALNFVSSLVPGEAARSGCRTRRKLGPGGGGGRRPGEDTVRAEPARRPLHHRH